MRIASTKGLVSAAHMNPMAADHATVSPSRHTNLRPLAHGSRLEISFQYMTNGPFADEKKRQELLAKLNELPGVRIENTSLSRRPSFRLAVLANESARSGFLDACDWFVDEVKSALALAP